MDGQYVRETCRLLKTSQRATDESDECPTEEQSKKDKVLACCTRCGRRDKEVQHLSHHCPRCKVTRYCGDKCKEKDKPFHLSFCGGYAGSGLPLPPVPCPRRGETLRTPQRNSPQCWKTTGVSALHDDCGRKPGECPRGGMRFLVGKRCFRRFGDQSLSTRYVNCRPFFLDEKL